MRKIVIGDWVTIQKRFRNYDWFTTKPLKVKDISMDGDKVILHLDYNFSKYIKDQFYSDDIVIDFVDYYPMRLEKLKRILEDD